MQSRAKTVAEFLRDLPPERKAEVEAVRKVILKNLPLGYEETMQGGMISYVIPLATYPDTYNGQALPIAALAAQKAYLSLYLMNVYGDKPTQEWFLREWEASGKKLDMGKACVRFKRASDLPLGLVGKVIARTSVDAFIGAYEASRPRKKR